MLASSAGLFNASRLANRLVDDWRVLEEKWPERRHRTLRRSDVGDPELEPTEASDALRSTSCLGPSGMDGVVSDPNILWLWLEYFWWNGEGISILIQVGKISFVVVGYENMGWLDVEPKRRCESMQVYK